MSKPKVSVNVGPLSRTLAEAAVPAPSAPRAPAKSKAFNAREQLAMAKALRTKRKQMPEIAVDASEDPEE